MTEFCPYCANPVLDTSEVVLTDDGWAHIECLSDEALLELLERLEDLESPAQR